MPIRIVIGVVACLATLVAHGASPDGAGHPPHHRLALIAADGVAVRAQPRASSGEIAELVQQTQVQVLRYKSTWAHIRFWGSAKGWVPRPDITFRKPWAVPSTYVAPQIHTHIRAHPTTPLHAVGVAVSPTAELARIGGSLAVPVASGQRLRLTAWAQTASGSLWYQDSGKRWISADAVRLITGDPSVARVGDVLLSSRVAGKGMWLTLGSIQHGAAAAVTKAARADGMTHLYVESAISPLGFHGKSSVTPLIEAAHRQHLRVIAWVYPYLTDVGADLDLTAQVAAFHTPSGQRFDGLALDIERNMDAPHVRTYLGLAREILGSKRLIVGVTYPPQSLPSFPFAEVGHFCNLIAPMDYWHQTRSSYGLNYGHMRYSYAYTYRYAVDSVNLIRDQVGARLPIAPIGQTFDDFGRLAMGPYAPSVPEIEGFLVGARASHSSGVSFFQWSSATEAEWQAISRYRF